MFEANAMFSANDIYSLADFQRNTKEHVDRLTKTKRPEVLTIKGKAQLIVQDARAYEQIVEELVTIKKVNAAAAFDRGEGRPVQEFFDEFEKNMSWQLKKYKIDLTKGNAEQEKRLPGFVSYQ